MVLRNFRHVFRSNALVSPTQDKAFRGIFRMDALLADVEEMLLFTLESRRTWVALDTPTVFMA